MSDAPYQPPAVPLITRNQWLYIKRKYALSPRELEVAELVCQGLTNSQIADDLQVKTGTVKTHLKGIFNKTRRRTKIALLLKFLDDVNELVSESPKAGRAAIVEVAEPDKKTPARTTVPKQKQ